MICFIEVMHILLGNLTRSRMAQLSILVLFQKAIEQWVTCLDQTPGQDHIPLTFVHMFQHSCHLYSMTSKTTMIWFSLNSLNRRFCIMKPNSQSCFLLYSRDSCFIGWCLWGVIQTSVNSVTLVFVEVCQRLRFVHYETSAIFIHSRGQQINTYMDPPIRFLSPKDIQTSCQHLLFFAASVSKKNVKYGTGYIFRPSVPCNFRWTHKWRVCFNFVLLLWGLLQLRVPLVLPCRGK